MHKTAVLLHPLGVLIVSLTGTGCGGTESAHPPCYPVRGIVTYNGKPAAGALVRLWPVGTHPSDTAAWKVVKPEATVDEDGSFQLFSFTVGDGAPAGKYNLTVRWRDPNNASLRTDQLGERYSDPKHPVIRVTIKEGENSLSPIDLKGPPLKSKKGDPKSGD